MRWHEIQLAPFTVQPFADGTRDLRVAPSAQTRFFVRCQVRKRDPHAHRAERDLFVATDQRPANLLGMAAGARTNARYQILAARDPFRTGIRHDRIDIPLMAAPERDLPVPNQRAERNQQRANQDAQANQPALDPRFHTFSPFGRSMLSLALFAETTR